MVKIKKTIITIITGAILIGGTGINLKKGKKVKKERKNVIKKIEKIKTPAHTLFTVPQYLNYQGYLTDSLGNPVNGNLSMEFRIYDAQQGGNLLWSRIFIIPVVNGIFSVILDPPPSIFSPGNPRYLELKVESDPPFPRTIISSMPWSFYSDTSFFAKYADTATYAKAASVSFVDSARVSGIHIKFKEGQFQTQLLTQVMF